jgi:hypothetical protein
MMVMISAYKLYSYQILHPVNGIQLAEVASPGETTYRSKFFDSNAVKKKKKNVSLTIFPANPAFILGTRNFSEKLRQTSEH